REPHLRPPRRGPLLCGEHAGRGRPDLDLRAQQRHPAVWRQAGHHGGRGGDPQRPRSRPRRQYLRWEGDLQGGRGFAESAVRAARTGHGLRRTPERACAARARSLDEFRGRNERPLSSFRTEVSSAAPVLSFVHPRNEVRDAPPPGFLAAPGAGTRGRTAGNTTGWASVWPREVVIVVVRATRSRPRRGAVRTGGEGEAPCSTSATTTRPGRNSRS